MELLLVEDDRLQAALYERVFERVIGRIHVAGSVADANHLIERTTAADVAVAVIDVVLADGSGFEVIDTLRARPELAAVPVVAWSASVDSADVARGRDDERARARQASIASRLKPAELPISPTMPRTRHRLAMTTYSRWHWPMTRSGSERRRA